MAAADVDPKVRAQRGHSASSKDSISAKERGPAKAVGAVASGAATAAAGVDQGEVAVEVAGLGPDRLAGVEAVRAEGVAELVVGRDPVERIDEAAGRVEDEPAVALGDEFGQGAEVADDDRRPLGERLEHDVAERLVDQRRDDHGPRPPEQGGDPGAVEPALEVDVVEPLGPLAKVGLERPGAGDPEVEVGEAGAPRRWRPETP